MKAQIRIMATTIHELKNWFLKGKTKGATHMIIVCSTFDWEDFPIYVMPSQDVKKEFDLQSKKEMQKIMEVYNLNKDISAQLNQFRTMEF